MEAASRCLSCLADAILPAPLVWVGSRALESFLSISLNEFYEPTPSNCAPPTTPSTSAALTTSAELDESAAFAYPLLVAPLPLEPFSRQAAELQCTTGAQLPTCNDTGMREASEEAGTGEGVSAPDFEEAGTGEERILTFTEKWQLPECQCIIRLSRVSFSSSCYSTGDNDDAIFMGDDVLTCGLIDTDSVESWESESDLWDRDGAVRQWDRPADWSRLAPIYIGSWLIAPDGEAVFVGRQPAAANGVSRGTCEPPEVRPLPNGSEREEGTRDDQDEAGGSGDVDKSAEEASRSLTLEVERTKGVGAGSATLSCVAEHEGEARSMGTSTSDTDEANTDTSPSNSRCVAEEEGVAGACRASLQEWASGDSGSLLGSSNMSSGSSISRVGSKMSTDESASALEGGGWSGFLVVPVDPAATSGLCLPQVPETKAGGECSVSSVHSLEGTDETGAGEGVPAPDSEGPEEDGCASSEGDAVMGLGAHSDLEVGTLGLLEEWPLNTVSRITGQTAKGSLTQQGVRGRDGAGKAKGSAVSSKSRLQQKPPTARGSAKQGVAMSDMARDKKGSRKVPSETATVGARVLKENSLGGRGTQGSRGVAPAQQGLAPQTASSDRKTGQHSKAAVSSGGPKVASVHRKWK